GRDLRAPGVALPLLGVRYVLSAPADPAPALDGLRLERVHDGDLRIDEVAGATPRAYLVHAADVEPSPAAAGRRLRAGYAFRGRARRPPPLCAARPPRGGRALAPRARPARGRARLAMTATVLVLTRDAGPSFAETLRAVQAQEPAADEVLVVDSGSTDGTVER